MEISKPIIQSLNLFKNVISWLADNLIEIIIGVVIAYIIYWLSEKGYIKTAFFWVLSLFEKDETENSKRDEEIHWVDADSYVQSK